MDRPVELIPLVCVQCSTRLPAEAGQVAWVCPQCGRGQLLTEKGLVPLTVDYAAGITPGTKGKPYWVAQGEVALQRQTYSGNQDSEARKFWSQPRRFFIPAFDLPLEGLLSLGRQLLTRPPALQPGSPAPFEPVTFSPEDVTPLAEFIVMALEADRSDKLKNVNIQLHWTESPTLWILPG
jgi:hypothetical protein